MVKARIIVEGKDDKNLIQQLLAHLIENKDISIEQENINYHQYIISMRGKSNLLNHKIYEKQGISQQVEEGKIDRILFIFDCDFEEDDKKCGGFNKSKRCIEDLIEQLDYPSEVEIDFYIFDKNLDYFLMETINNRKCSKSFHDLTTCLKLEETKPNRKPIANLYRNFYPNPYFDFSYDKFSEIKEKLTKLFSHKKGNP